MNLFFIIEALRETTKRKEKEEVLRALAESGSMENELFQKVCKATYDSDVNYFVTDVGERKPLPTRDYICLSQAIDILHSEIATREVTGNAANDRVNYLYSKLNEDSAKIFKLIIDRDFDAGVGPKTINKVWPDLIYLHPYMRCSSFSEKNLKNIQFPCLSQVKMDGLYVDIIVTTDIEGDVNVEYRSRYGNKLPFHNKQRQTAMRMLLDEYGDFVLQGEAIALTDARLPMSRKEGNGYLNSSDIDPDRIRFYLWDIVPYEVWTGHEKCVETYDRRFGRLKEVVGDDEVLSLQMVDTVLCENKQDIIDHFKTMRENGEEGTVLKDFRGMWKDGTSKHCVKAKAEFVVDMVITGWRKGKKGKWEDGLGSVQCKSSDGKVVVYVSGFTDEMRQYLFENIDTMIDNEQIMEVKGNDVVDNKLDDSDAPYAIYLPRFEKLRKDKTEADSYDRIMEQLKACTDTFDIIG